MALSFDDPKDPDAVLDYSVDWSAWLAGDVIVSSSWKGLTEGLVLDSDSANTSVATAWFSGGNDGATAYATNHIVTAAGREDDRTVRIKIKEL